MRISPLPLPGLFRVGLSILYCVVLVAGSFPMTPDESFLSKPSKEWTETEAMQVLNDSPWAHTITTTIQDFQCDLRTSCLSGNLSRRSCAKARFHRPYASSRRRQA